MVACFFADKVLLQNTFPSIGNVGIGTTSPTGLPDVIVNAFINGMRVGISSSPDTLTTVAGRKALQFPASRNAAIGSCSQYLGESGKDNRATGHRSLHSNADGHMNTVSGSNAMPNSYYGDTIQVRGMYIV